MAAKVLNGVPIAGDAVKWFVNEAYVFESLKIINASGGDIEDVDLTMHPVDINLGAGTATLVEVINEANIDGFIAAHEKLELMVDTVATVLAYPVLVRGPAIIWQDGLPLDDFAGATYTPATILTQIAAMPGNVLVRSGSSALSSTQTT